MTCIKVTWVDHNDNVWFNLFDEMPQAVRYIASRTMQQLKEVSRIDIQTCNISNLADTQPIPVSQAAID